MKRNLLLTLALIITGSFFMAKAQQTAKVTPSGIGYLEYLPNGYHANSNKYPIVIALHGIQEKGTASTDPKRVLADLPKVAYVGLPKYAKAGQKYPFILISPQLKSNFGSWPPSFIMEVLNHVKRTLRVDDKRIYLTGLSLGGMGVWKTAGEYPKVFAAIAPICPGGNALDKANTLAAENVAAWGFHGTRDFVVSYTVTTKMIDALNSAPKKPNPLAKVTLFPNMGHNVWDRAYQETNVLSWMLSFKKGSSASSSSSEDSNKPPVVNAGADQTISLPAHSVTLEGTASDPDGKISSYEWSQVAGEKASLGETSSAQFKVSELGEGSYEFKLTVKDNDGATASDKVSVTVKASGNKKPVINAGADKTINLPTNSVTIRGTGADPDGEISSYTWTKVSGGNATMNGTSSEELKASDLEEGSYVFRLTVRDNDGASVSDDVNVTVQKAENKPPIVNAGGDKTIRLPDNVVNLAGTATDSDGEIDSYSWTQITGAAASLSGATTANLNVTDLTEGTYTFRLTVKDDQGVKNSDNVNVFVRKAFSENNPPVVNAGADRTLRLPETSLNLQGDATDEDGSIASYEWTQISGSPASLSESGSGMARISGLKEGIYAFRLTASDNNGSTSADEVIVYVREALSTDIQPSDNSGLGRAIELPFDIFKLRDTPWYNGYTSD